MHNTSNILIRNARVLTMDPEGRDLPCADLLIKDGIIARIGQNLSGLPEASGAEIIEAKGLLAMPGLINSHFHSPGNFMKGALADMPLEVFMLYEVPPCVDTPPSPRLNYVRTMLGAMEMLKTGTTAVFDDAFHVPLPSQDRVDGIMQAYTDCGLRATVTLDQATQIEYEKYPYLYDLCPEPVRQRMRDTPRVAPKDMLEMYDWFIGAWHNTANGRINVGVSCSAPQRVDLPYHQALVELSNRHNLPFAVHILETKLQRVLGEQQYGGTLIKYCHKHHLLNERTEVIHAIWVDEEDMDLLADAGCTVSHQPLCNLKLGSGIMPFRSMRERGIPIGLGSDEACSDDAINMWNVAKFGGIIHKISGVDYRLWPSAEEVLSCLFHGGARALGCQDRIGQIREGFAADLILVDLNTLAFTPMNNLQRQLVFCESGSSVVMTMVDGRVLFQNGKLLCVDEEALKAEARELMREYDQILEKSGQDMEQLERYYRAMYLRTSAQDVGMNRWAGTVRPATE